MHYFLLESGKRPRPKYLPLDAFDKNSSLFLDQPILSEAYCIPEGQSPWFLPLCLPKVNSLGRVEGFPFLLGTYSVLCGACGSILHLGKASEERLFPVGRPVARFAVVVDPHRAISHLSHPEIAVLGKHAFPLLHAALCA